MDTQNKLVINEVDPVTGKITQIEEISIKNVFQQCKDGCSYVVADMGKREAVCNKCGMTRIFVIGRDNVTDDLVVTFQKN